MRQVQADEAPRSGLRQVRRRSDAGVRAPQPARAHRTGMPGLPCLVLQGAAEPHRTGTRPDSPRVGTRPLLRVLYRPRSGRCGHLPPARAQGPLRRRGSGVAAATVRLLLRGDRSSLLAHLGQGRRPEEGTVHQRCAAAADRTVLREEGGGLPGEDRQGRSSGGDGADLPVRARPRSGEPLPVARPGHRVRQEGTQDPQGTVRLCAGGVREAPPDRRDRAGDARAGPGTPWPADRTAPEVVRFERGGVREEDRAAGPPLPLRVGVTGRSRSGTGERRTASRPQGRVDRRRCLRSRRTVRVPNRKDRRGSSGRLGSDRRRPPEGAAAHRRAARVAEAALRQDGHRVPQPDETPRQEDPPPDGLGPRNPRSGGCGSGSRSRGEGPAQRRRPLGAARSVRLRGELPGRPREDRRTPPGAGRDRRAGPGAQETVRRHGRRVPRADEDSRHEEVSLPARLDPRSAGSGRCEPRTAPGAKRDLHRGRDRAPAAAVPLLVRGDPAALPDRECSARRAAQGSGGHRGAGPLAEAAVRSVRCGIPRADEDAGPDFHGGHGRRRGEAVAARGRPRRPLGGTSGRDAERTLDPEEGQGGQAPEGRGRLPQVRESPGVDDHGRDTGPPAGPAAPRAARRRAVRDQRSERVVPKGHQPQQPTAAVARTPGARCDRSQRKADAPGSGGRSLRQRPPRPRAQGHEQPTPQVPFRHPEGQAGAFPSEPAREAGGLFRTLGHRRRARTETAPVRPSQEDGAGVVQAVPVQPPGGGGAGGHDQTGPGTRGTAAAGGLGLPGRGHQRALRAAEPRADPPPARHPGVRAGPGGRKGDPYPSAGVQRVQRGLRRRPDGGPCAAVAGGADRGVGPHAFVAEHPVAGARRPARGPDPGHGARHLLPDEAPGHPSGEEEGLRDHRRCPSRSRQR